MNRKSIRIVGVLSKITLAEDQPQTTLTTKPNETATSKSNPRKRAAKRNKK